MARPMPRLFLVRHGMCPYERFDLSANIPSRRNGVVSEWVSQFAGFLWISDHPSRVDDMQVSAFWIMSSISIERDSRPAWLTYHSPKGVKDRWRESLNVWLGMGVGTFNFTSWLEVIIGIKQQLWLNQRTSARCMYPHVNVLTQPSIFFLNILEQYQIMFSPKL